MTNEENNKHLTDLESQEISGKDVIGGGSGDIGITNDFSGQSGLEFEVAPTLDAMQPIDQISIVNEAPVSGNSGTPTFDGIGPSFSGGPVTLD